MRGMTSPQMAWRRPQSVRIGPFAKSSERPIIGSRWVSHEYGPSAQAVDGRKLARRSYRLLREEDVIDLVAPDAETPRGRQTPQHTLGHGLIRKTARLA